jgi:nitroreductase
LWLKKCDFGHCGCRLGPDDDESLSGSVLLGEKNENTYIYICAMSIQQRKENYTMNETMEVIKNRRSIRKFKDKQIPGSELQEILDCTLPAPNAGNQQKWHFTMIQSKDMLERMERILKENMMNSGVDFLAKRASDPNVRIFGDAPTVIFITADERPRFVQIDCAVAAQNILIAAESLNMGSHIMTSSEFLFTSEKGNELERELGIPNGYNHICTIALGYKDENPQRNREEKM